MTTMCKRACFRITFCDGVVGTSVQGITEDSMCVVAGRQQHVKLLPAYRSLLYLQRGSADPKEWEALIECS
jgi:hypothetical protein